MLRIFFNVKYALEVAVNNLQFISEVQICFTTVEKIRLLENQDDKHSSLMNSFAEFYFYLSTGAFIKECKYLHWPQLWHIFSLINILSCT